MRLLSLRAHRAKLLLPLACVVGLLLLGVIELTYQRSHAAMMSLGARGEARTAINTLIRRMLDAETQLRGYLLTGRVDYMEPGAETAKDVADALDHLDGYFRGDARLRGVMADLRDRKSVV